MGKLMHDNILYTSGTSALANLTDVDITTPTDGQTLVYDNTNSKWVNGAGGSGSAKQTAVTQAEYNALVQAGTVDPTMEYFITDGIPSSIEYYHNYSTTEHIVGSWIDGKTLYEITVTGTATDSTNTEVSKVIFDGAGFVDKYISVDGTLQTGAVGYDNQVLSGYVNATNHVGFYKPNGNKEVRIYYNSSAYAAGSTYVATIRYTKTSS